MKLPSTLFFRQSKQGIIVIVVLVLCLGGAGYAYFGRTAAQKVDNANKTNTTKLDNPITTTNSSKSSAGTISVPCGCQQKNKQTQPGQTSTSGITLQNGSTGSTQIQTCNPCPMDGATSSTVASCPEYMCKAPAPTPTPIPTPTPSPTPGCGTCGGGYRKAVTTSSLHVCPMYCME
jgi:hypothetical protein